MYTGTFDSPEHASAAHMSVHVMKDHDTCSAKLSPFRADEADGVFDAAKKEALETVQAMMDSDEHSDGVLV